MFFDSFQAFQNRHLKIRHKRPQFASNIYQTLKKFSMGYVLHDTNSTPMFAIFIKSQIYIYSYLTIWPDNFHLPPPQQKKAAHLTVLSMPPSTSQV